jgi:hypothetical protein
MMIHVDSATARLHGEGREGPLHSRRPDLARLTARRTSTYITLIEQGHRITRRSNLGHDLVVRFTRHAHEAFDRRSSEDKSTFYSFPFPLTIQTIFSAYAMYPEAEGNTH